MFHITCFLYLFTFPLPHLTPFLNVFTSNAPCSPSFLVSHSQYTLHLTSFSTVAPVLALSCFFSFFHLLLLLLFFFFLYPSSFIAIHPLISLLLHLSTFAPFASHIYFSYSYSALPSTTSHASFHPVFLCLPDFTSVSLLTLTPIIHTFTPSSPNIPLSFCSSSSYSSSYYCPICYHYALLMGGCVRGVAGP